MASKASTSTEEELHLVTAAFNEASVHGLEVELIVWALKAQRENPHYTLEDSLNAALEAWDIV